MSTDEILQRLCDDEQNFVIRCFWDEGVEWRLGDDRVNGVVTHGHAPTVAEALKALAEAKAAHSPDSDFARWWRA